MFGRVPMSIRFYDSLIFVQFISIFKLKYHKITNARTHVMSLT